MQYVVCLFIYDSLTIEQRFIQTFNLYLVHLSKLFTEQTLSSVKNLFNIQTDI
jgi:hypothetical protein